MVTAVILLVLAAITFAEVIAIIDAPAVAYSCALTTGNNDYAPCYSTVAALIGIITHQACATWQHLQPSRSLLITCASILPEKGTEEMRTTYRASAFAYSQLSRGHRATRGPLESQVAGSSTSLAACAHDLMFFRSREREAAVRGSFVSVRTTTCPVEKASATASKSSMSLVQILA